METFHHDFNRWAQGWHVWAVLMEKHTFADQHMAFRKLGSLTSTMWSHMSSTKARPCTGTKIPQTCGNIWGRLQAGGNHPLLAC